MSLATLGAVLAGLYLLGAIWDIADPDAVTLKFNSGGRLLLSLTMLCFVIAFVASALALSTLAVVCVVLAIIALAGINAALS